MLQTCSNAKAEGITIFTVAVGVTDKNASDRLAECATDPNKAISVEDSRNLAKVFENIGNLILATRLTR